MFFPAAIFILGIRLVTACGIAVHVSVISRVHSFLPKQAYDFQAQLIAGSFFPDAFYNCLGNKLSQLAEETHWPDFLKRIVVYTKTASLSESEKNELKSFIYGLYAHQIADVSWHSLHLNQGMLKALAALEFDGDIESAHTFLDTGGDFMLLKRLLSSQNPFKKETIRFLQLEWVYPTQHILNVFHDMGYTVDSTSLRICMVRGFSALQAEINIVDSSYSFYASESPLLDGMLDDYYFGGLQDIYNTVQTCFQGLDNWFANGVSDDPWDVCGIFVKTNKISLPYQLELRQEPPLEDISTMDDESISKLSEPPIFITSYMPLSSFGDDIAIGEFLGPSYGKCIAIGAQYEESDGSIYVVPIGEFSSIHTTQETFDVRLLNHTRLHANFKSLKMPSRFGSTLIAYNLLDLELLVASSPGDSLIKIFNGNTLLLNIFDKTSSSKVGSMGTKQIGFDIITDDFNNDGVQDLIISSPLSDAGDHVQQGTVIVLDGLKIIKAITTSSGSDRQSVLSNDGSFWVEVSDLKMTTFHIPNSLQLESSYERFGSSLSTTSRFMMVGVQSMGSVLVYEKHESITVSEEPKYVITKDCILTFNEYQNSDLTRMKSKVSGLFGSNIQSAKLSNVEYFIISAPTQTIADCLNCGLLKLYIIDTNSPKLVTNIVIPVNRKNSFTKFGHSIAVSEDGSYMYISGPGYSTNRGSIWKVNIKDILQVHLTDSNANIESISLSDEDLVILGENRYTGFGENIELIGLDGQDILVIGLPFFGYDEMWDDNYKMIGKVGIYKLSA